MNLKLRYSLFLFFILGLLVLFCIGSVKLLSSGQYIATVCLLGVLYLITFLLGKKFAKIFFVLSFLRLLRQNNGSVSHQRYENFMENALGKRKTPRQRAQLTEDVLQSLIQEELVSSDGETITLLSS